MKWFRFYSEFMDDPKIAMMSDSDQLLWVKALCLASDSSTRGEICLTDEEICWKLRINPETWRHAIDKFRAKGIIEHIKGGYKITNWDKRQFESDNASQRVSKHRGSKTSVKQKQPCNVTCNVTVTPSEQIQIQNTDPDSDPEHKNSVLPLYSLNACTENQKEGEVVEPSQGFCEEERPEPKLEDLTPINPTGLSRPILHSPAPPVPPRPPSPNILPFGQSFNNPESKSWFEWQTGPGPNDYDPEFVDFLAGKWNRSKADVKRFFQKNRSNPEAISVYFEDFKGSDNDLQQVVANVMRRKMEGRHGFAANW